MHGAKLSQIFHNSYGITSQEVSLNNQTIVPFGNFANVGPDSGYTKILLKFNFTNPKHLPIDLPKQQHHHLRNHDVSNMAQTVPLQDVVAHIRPNNQAMDSRQVKKAFESGTGTLAAVGRVREGRVDTGEHFIDNVHNIHAGCLVRGLTVVGYKLTQCDWFFKKGEGVSPYASKKPVSDKYVVTVGFSLDRGVAMEFPERTVVQRRELAKTCWDWCHGWANPDGVITLNFGGRKPDGKVQNSVVIRNWKLGAARVEEIVTEKDE